MTRILVTGATGRLGRLVVAGLQARGLTVRAFTRDADAARSRLGNETEFAQGDLRDGPSIAAALKDVSRVFLLSPIDELLAQQQTAVAHHAKAAGVEGIVKLSGSHWTIEPAGRSLSGDAHWQVETVLATLGLPTVSLRPNAWMQVALGRIADDVRQGRLESRYPDAAVSYIDARDIADVAVQILSQPELPAGPLVLTGAHAVTHRVLVRQIESLTGQRIELRDVSQSAPQHDAPRSFTERAHGQFADLIRGGAAAGVTSVVQTVLGRSPRSIEAYVTEQLGH